MVEYKYNVLTNNIEYDGEPIAPLNVNGASTIVSLLNKDKEEDTGE